jgi:DNA-binding response OmpR family regulator
MRIRALIFEDDEAIRTILRYMLSARGYEVHTYPTPAACPLRDADMCYIQCADVVISDVAMPLETGLQFVEQQVRMGCQIRNMALMSGAWTPEDAELAREMGCHVINKPFAIEDIYHWLDLCERNIDPARVLKDVPVGATA